MAIGKFQVTAQIEGVTHYWNGNGWITDKSRRVTLDYQSCTRIAQKIRSYQSQLDADERVEPIVSEI